MEFTTKTLENLSQINQEDFDSIFPNKIENYSFYKAIEESKLENFTLFYAAAYKDGRLAGIMPFYSMDYALDTTIRGAMRKLLWPLLKLLNPILTVRVLMCGNPVADFADIGISGAVKDKDALLRALIDELNSACRRLKSVFISFKDFNKDRYQYLFDFLRARGYYQIPTFPCSQLRIKAKTFDEYLAGLSRSTRKDIRRKLKNAKDIDIKLDIRDDISDIIDEIYPLYLNMFKDSDIHFEKLTKDAFKKISDNMKGVAKFFLYKVDNKLSAFNLMFIKGDHLIDKYIGIDKDINKKYQMYFLTWCINIDWAIKNGIKLYTAGQTDYEPKLRLGCELEDLYMLYKSTIPLLNPFFGVFGLFLKPENFDHTLRKLKSKKIKQKAGP